MENGSLYDKLHIAKVLFAVFSTFRILLGSIIMVEQIEGIEGCCKRLIMASRGKPPSCTSRHKIVNNIPNNCLGQCTTHNGCWYRLKLISMMLFPG